MLVSEKDVPVLTPTGNPSRMILYEVAVGTESQLRSTWSAVTCAVNDVGAVGTLRAGALV